MTSNGTRAKVWKCRSQALMGRAALRLASDRLWVVSGTTVAGPKS